MTSGSVLSPRERTLVYWCLLGFALVTADVVVGGPLTHVDTVVRERIGAPRDDLPSWLAHVSDLGGVGLSAAVLGIVSITYAQMSWRVWPVALAVTTWVSTGVVVLAVKLAVSRPGPGLMAERTGYSGYFPSGHTATATVTAGTVVLIAVTSRRSSAWTSRATPACLWVAVAVGVLVGAYAVWADYHWLSDVVGGLVIAVPVLVVASGVCRRYARPALPTRQLP